MTFIPMNTAAAATLKADAAFLQAHAAEAGVLDAQRDFYECAFAHLLAKQENIPYFQAADRVQAAEGEAGEEYWEVYKTSLRAEKLRLRAIAAAEESALAAIRAAQAEADRVYAQICEEQDGGIAYWSPEAREDARLRAAEAKLAEVCAQHPTQAEAFSKWQEAARIRAAQY